MEAAEVASWMFAAEVPIPGDVANLLIPGEQAVAAYQTFRDSAIFTTHRLIVRDSQGIRGKRWRPIPSHTPQSTCGPAKTPAPSTSPPKLPYGPAPGTSRSSWEEAWMFAALTSSSPTLSSINSGPGWGSGRCWRQVCRAWRGGQSKPVGRLAGRRRRGCRNRIRQGSGDKTECLF